MALNLLIENLRNPALLFFILGVLAVRFKSDLEIPPNSSKFISLYLLFAIGFKGGQELAHSEFDVEIFWSLHAGILVSGFIAFYTFFILKQKLSISNSVAIASSYGSVSAVTFVTAVNYLEVNNIEFGGHMVAVMALMESPAIIVGVFLLKRFRKDGHDNLSFGKVLHHSLTNASVYLIIGSLLIGFMASDAQAKGIEPFTSDIFKGFLVIFLLDMGIISGRNLNAFFKAGWFTASFAILMPFINGVLMAFISQLFCTNPGDCFLLSVLAASASYIAVPAAMKMVAPESDPGLYIPMALAVTFPVNITLGLPVYWSFVNALAG